MINATEGGLGFKGIPNISLQEAAERFLKEPQAKINLIDQEIQKHAFKGKGGIDS